jgi:glycosyltransferase involved in cell wall biosynthesis
VRIGFDVTPITPNRTGVGTYVYQLLRHVVALAPTEEFLGFAANWHGLDHDALHGLLPYRYWRIPTRVMYRLWDVFPWLTVDRLCPRVEIFHATNYYLPPTRKARRVLTVYDLSFFRYPHLASPKIVGPFLRRVKYFAQKADAVLTCSETSQEDIMEFCEIPKDKITVAYGAASSAFYPMVRDDAAAMLRRQYSIEPPYILFVGTLEPRKNVIGLLRAFVLARAEIPHRLFLVGPRGWSMMPIEELIAGLGLGGRVRYLGYAPNEDVLRALYSAADAFVFPSFYEGFGLPVLEAMACGCPVIASSRGALREVAGDAALYVEPDDIEDMAATLAALGVNSDLAARLREKARARAQCFSWTQTAEQTLGVYRKLV